MAVRHIIAVGGLLLFPGLSQAASAGSAADPKAIAQALDACLASDKGGSTYGIVQCNGDAYRGYDTLLNQVYEKLTQSLDPASRELLRHAQRIWLEGRKADGSLWNGPWRRDAGTISQIEAAQSDVEAVHSRLTQLQALLTAATPG